MQFYEVGQNSYPIETEEKIETIEKFAMNPKMIKVQQFTISNELPFVLLGGMNVLESRDLAMEVAESYCSVTNKLN